MKTYQIKLSPASSFQGLPTSDTLFGAICWGTKRVCDESKLADILEGFKENPKFVISSSFPYIESNGNYISFYPKPITQGLPLSDINEIAKDKREKVKAITWYKKFNKAEYMSLSIFERLLTRTPENVLFQEYFCENGDVKLDEKLLMSKKEYEDIFQIKKPSLKKALVQKNSIDRLTMSTGKEGEMFYQEECYTNPAFKLHFLMKTDDIDFFKPIFRYLEDKGIGGNRSTGKGRFKIEVIGEVSIGDNTSCRFITLSRYIPDVSEINLDSKSMFYEILPCRSKVDAEAELKGEDVRKSRVIYLKEGSCLEANGRKEFYGRVPVVKEIQGQKIYQNGLAFPVFGKFGGLK